MSNAKVKLPPGVKPVKTLPQYCENLWVLGRSGKWARITSWGQYEQRIEIEVNGRAVFISLAKVLGWAEKPLVAKPPAQLEVKENQGVKDLKGFKNWKPAPEVEEFPGISLVELNAWLIGNPFKAGDRVRYIGDNENCRRQYGDKDLKVHTVLESDPHWLNCIYEYGFYQYGKAERRQAFTTWLKSSDLELLGD